MADLAFHPHHYGDRFHLINDPFMQTLLTELCLPQTQQPQINRLVQALYGGLISVASRKLLPTLEKTVQTRMQAALTAQIFDCASKAVTVNLARAGTYPSHVCYEYLHWFLKPENVRQDHIFAARITDNAEKVTGTHLGSYKIGGDIKNRTIIFPDPMGATGGTILSAIDYYQKHIEGPAKQYIALHLIVTPEYLKKILSQPTPIQVFALRVDRGLSSPEILKSPLGLYWDKEKGLNEKQYIVPGAGGLGELLNNSFV